MATYDPVDKQWSGPQIRCPYNSKVGLGELMLYALDRNPDKIVQISDDYQTKSTASDIRLKSIRVCENLRKHGIEIGDVCALVSRNNPNVAPIIFGCLLNGSPINTLDVRFDQQDFAHMFSLTKPKAIFCEVGVYETIKHAILELRIDPLVFLFGADEEECYGSFTQNISTLFKPVTAEGEYIPRQIPDTSKHVAFIICSSGTSGPSNGVCLTHAQVISQTLRAFPVNTPDILVNFSSLYWLIGICTLLIGTVEGVTRIITTEPFSPKLFFRLVSQYKISNCFLAPSQIVMCLESAEIKYTNLNSIKTLMTGGSTVLEEVVLKFQKRISDNAKLIIGYGLSEIGTFSNLNFKWDKINCVGVPNAEHRFKIMSETGAKLGPGETGVIWILAPIPFYGYYGNEEKHREICDEEGWINTGDLGYFDDEGDLFIVGRKKEIIKYKGYQISPSSIELMLQLKTGLTEICVIGVEDPKHGTDLPAAVIVRPRACPLTEKEVIKIVNENITGVKQLRGGIYFMDELPKTAAGKIKKNILKDRVKHLYLTQNN